MTHRSKPHNVLFWSGTCIVLMLITYLGLNFSGIIGQTSDVTAHAAQGLATPTSMNTRIQTPGIPAILPRTGAFSSNQPSFTRDDVTYYANMHLLPQTQLSSGTLTVANVSFMLSQQASSMFQGEPIGVADDTLVCVVELHGNVVFLHNAPGATKPLAFTRVYEVFDAHSGNLLMWGGLD